MQLSYRKKKKKKKKQQKKTTNKQIQSISIMKHRNILTLVLFHLMKTLLYGRCCTNNQHK